VNARLAVVEVTVPGCSRILCVLLVVALALPASSRAGTNLLPNGTFSGADQISGWTLFVDANTGTLSWNTADADATAGSGSMQLDTDSFGEPTMASSACLAVPAGRPVSVVAETKVLSGSIGATDYGFSFTCSIYPTPDCSGGSTATLGGVLPQSTSWLAAATDGTTPNDAASAKCSVEEQNPFIAAKASVLFDNLAFNLVAVVSLLPGGDFDSAAQVSAWTLFNDINVGMLSWSNDDAAGDGNSGSMQFDTDPIGEPTLARSPCFPVPAGGGVSVCGESRVLAGSGFDYQFDFSCSIYSSPGCTSMSYLSGLTPTVAFSSAWTAMTPASGILPGNARAADCTVTQSNVYSSTLGSVRFDALFFAADYIYHDGFD